MSHAQLQKKQNLKTKDILSNVNKEIVNRLSKKKNLSAIFGQTRLPTIGNINICKNLYQGSYECCGNVTYGGTESLLLACLSYRDYYYKPQSH